MANVLFGGFKPVDELRSRARRYEVASGYGTAIFPGDCAIITNDGVVEAATAGATKIIGVVKCVSYVRDGKREEMKYLPASTTYSPTTRGSRNASYVWVYDDPNTEFVGCVSSHADTDTEAEVFAALGENVDIVAGAGNTVYGRSGHTLAGAVAGATAQARVTEILRVPARDLASANFMVKFVWNEHVHAFTDAASV